MKLPYLIPLVLASCFAAEPIVSDWKNDHPDWVEAVNDDFEAPTLNSKIWSRIAMQKSGKISDWMRYQSKDKKLVQIKDGNAILWGRHGKYTSQNDLNGENPGYACGGFYSFKKFAFRYGYIEVRAQFDSVRGCWPAIWLKSAAQDPKNWCRKGEIDIMEHCNSDDIAYQTLHFSQDDGTGHRTVSSKTRIDKKAFNTYGLLWEEGCITFYINGKVTKVIDKHGKSWPFDDKDNKFFIIIDQQIGGSWVESAGPIDKKTLSEKGAAFTIDHVIVYADPRHIDGGDKKLTKPQPQKPAKEADGKKKIDLRNRMFRG